MHQRPVALEQAIWDQSRERRVVFLQGAYRGLRRHWCLQRGREPWHAYFFAGSTSQFLLHLQFHGHNWWKCPLESIFDSEPVQTAWSEGAESGGRGPRHGEPVLPFFSMGRQGFLAAFTGRVQECHQLTIVPWECSQGAKRIVRRSWKEEQNSSPD